jgi:hypothetical protein
VVFRKHVRCLLCGCVYSFGEARAFVGRGDSADEARRRATRRAWVWARGRKPKGACPGCGRFPAGVATRARRLRHALTFGPAFFGLVVLFWIVADVVHVNSDLVAMAVAAVVAGASVGHAVVELFGTNRNPAAGLERAESAVRSGAITVVKPGEPTDLGADARAGRRRASLAVVVGGLAAALAFAAPAYRVENGWELDPHTFPGVCGPGEEVRIFFDEPIDTINNHWRGRATGVVEYEVAGGRMRSEVAAQAVDKSWGERINVNGRTRAHVWAEVSIPADAPVGGVVRYDLELMVTYPKQVGAKNFEVVGRELRQVAEVRVRPAGAGATYTRLLWTGLLAAMGLTLLLGATLCLFGYPAPNPATWVSAEPVAE